jgi:HD-GYP domain-containing protein (c-di-GMP phosphodiesterase class II)
MSSGTAEQLRSIRYLADSTAKMQNGLIITMADLVENRDSDTGAHIQKTAAYVKIIAEGLKRKGYYAEKLTPKFISDIVTSAPLHDIGKIHISDTILNKPGKLTPEEYEIMKTHTTAGREIMEKAISTVNGENYLKEAKNMAAYHHERWDGKGYPAGLAGKDIPLHARVVSIADAYDAMRSDRIYRKGLAPDRIRAELVKGSGTQFDPSHLEVFLRLVDDGTMDDATRYANEMLSTSVEMGLIDAPSEYISGAGSRHRA